MSVFIQAPIHISIANFGIRSPRQLKEARLVANLSQKKLGIAAGMDQFSASARMNHYEIGRHTPDYSTLNRIAAIGSLFLC